MDLKHTCKLLAQTLNGIGCTELVSLSETLSLSLSLSLSLMCLLSPGSRLYINRMIVSSQMSKMSSSHVTLEQITPNVVSVLDFLVPGPLKI